MDRGFLRFLAAVALVFILAGDLRTMLSPLLNVLSPITNNLDKTGGQPAESRQDSDDDDTHIKLGEDAMSARLSLMATIKNSCLPKLICELNATPYRERLSETERSLLNLIRDTSISITAETTSKYHFAAHMGQLIAGVEGTGCHNFYPLCPFPGLKVLQMMKKVKIR